MKVFFFNFIKFNFFKSAKFHLIKLNIYIIGKVNISFELKAQKANFFNKMEKKILEMFTQIYCIEHFP